MTLMASLQSKIQNKEAKILILGLGYVGLPLLLETANKGFSVIGLDTNEAHLDSIRKGNSPFINIPHAKIAHCLNTHDAIFTSDSTIVAQADIIIICLPTPLNKHHEPDLEIIVSALEKIKSHIKHGTMISLESTTWPGTTKELVLPILESAGHKAGETIAVVYSPEREDPGNKLNVSSIPKVLGGITPKCTEIGTLFYSQIVVQVVPVSSTETAELTKLVENIQRLVNISLMNELKVLAKHMNIDIFEVIDAASTKPFGFTPYYPGPGLGGHCIPIDPFYLTWKAREYGLHTRFIELAGEINHQIIDFVIWGISRELNIRFAKAINGAHILILGVAYKKNVNDVRESPAIKIITELESMGAIVSYHDPLVPYLNEYTSSTSHAKQSREISAEMIQNQDAIVIVTDHDNVEYELVQQHAQLIIDTRNTKRICKTQKVVAY